jgi:hypothetical protein
MEKQFFEYVHKIPAEDVSAIGGHYRLIDEITIQVDSVRILYLRGYAILEHF